MAVSINMVIIAIFSLLFLVGVLARLFVDMLIILLMKEENIREAMVLFVEGKMKFDVAGEGIKDAFSLDEGKIHVGEMINEGEMCTVYWFDIMDNWFYRLNFGGVMRVEDKDSVREKVITELIASAFGLLLAFFLFWYNFDKIF